MPETVNESQSESPNQTPGISAKFKCKGCSKKFNSLISLTNHVKSHCPATARRKASKAPCYCTLCNKKFRLDADLRVHLKWHCPVSRQSWKCKQCGLWFGNEVSQYLHLKDSCRVQAPEKSLLPTMTTFPCPRCPKKFETDAHLQNHIKLRCPATKKSNTDFEGMVNCTRCSKKFTTIADLQRHVRLYCQATKTPAPDSRTVVIKCLGCSKEFATKAYLENHVKLRCPATKKSTPDPLTLVKCPTCSKEFATDAYLKYHVKRCPPVKKPKTVNSFTSVNCPQCSSAFRNESFLENHLKTYCRGAVGEPITCSGCGKILQNQYYYRIHIRSLCSSIQAKQPQQLPPIADENAFKPTRSEETLGTQFICILPHPFLILSNPLLPNPLLPKPIELQCSSTENPTATPAVPTPKSNNSKYFTVTTENTVSCKRCGKTMPANARTKYKHRKKYCLAASTIKSEINQSHTMESVAASLIIVKCNHCTETCKASLIAEHERTHGDNHICPYCPTGFKMLTSLLRHKLLMHPKSRRSRSNLEPVILDELPVHKEEIQITYGSNSSTSSASLPKLPIILQSRRHRLEMDIDNDAVFSDNVDIGPDIASSPTSPIKVPKGDYFNDPDLNSPMLMQLRQFNEQCHELDESWVKVELSTEVFTNQEDPLEPNFTSEPIHIEADNSSEMDIEYKFSITE